MHGVKISGLLLPMIRGVCVCLCVCLLLRCAKTAGPIEVPCGLWTRMGPRNHVFAGGTDPEKMEIFGGANCPIWPFVKIL